MGDASGCLSHAFNEGVDKLLNIVCNLKQAYLHLKVARLYAPANSVSLAVEANSLDTLESNARLKSGSDAYCL